jgi:hypothetical protein
MMQPKARMLLACGLWMALAAGSAGAVNCYTVLDRSDNVVYRGAIPPIDLSERGQPEWEAMRQRGQHMIAMETDRCLGIEFFTGVAGSATLSVDQIVGGIPTRGKSSGGNAAQVGTSAPTPVTSGGGVPMPRAPPTAPPKRSSY